MVFACASAGDAFAARYPELLEPASRPTPHEEGVLMLARPDGYIGLSTAAGDWPGVDTYLQGVRL
jgi:hypothetical protein